MKVLLPFSTIIGKCGKAAGIYMEVSQFDRILLTICHKARCVECGTSACGLSDQPSEGGEILALRKVDLNL